MLKNKLYAMKEKVGDALPSTSEIFSPSDPDVLLIPKAYEEERFALWREELAAYRRLGYAPKNIRTNKERNSDGNLTVTMSVDEFERMYSSCSITVAEVYCRGLMALFELRKS